MLFKCNQNNVKDLQLTSTFYLELPICTLNSEKKILLMTTGITYRYIIWKNRDIRIDKKPSFTRNITTLVSGL